MLLQLCIVALMMLRYYQNLFEAPICLASQAKLSRLVLELELGDSKVDHLGHVQAWVARAPADSRRSAYSSSRAHPANENCETKALEERLSLQWDIMEVFFQCAKLFLRI